MINSEIGRHESVCLGNTSTNHGKTSHSRIVAANFSEMNSGFDWGNEIQGHLLSAFVVGYIFGNIIGGSLVAFMGAKKFTVLSMALIGLLQLASPIAASQGPWFLYSLRFLFGVLVSGAFSQD